MEIVVDTNVLFINVNIQHNIKGLVKPLEREGIDTFFSERDNVEQSRINKHEAVYYNTPPVAESSDQKISEFINKSAYKIITASFEEGYKWRLSNGQDKITASLKDEDFIKKINSNEVSIAKEDILVVEMKTTQWQNLDNIKTENEIVKVLEHRKTANQLTIPME